MSFKTKAEFIVYLEETLIPDLRVSGSNALADDYATAVRFMREPTPYISDDERPFFRGAFVAWWQAIVDVAGGARAFKNIPRHVMKHGERITTEHHVKSIGDLTLFQLYEMFR